MAAKAAGATQAGHGLTHLEVFHSFTHGLHDARVFRTRYEGQGGFILNAFRSPAIYLAFAGVVSAWLLYLKYPHIPVALRAKLGPVYKVLDNKYWFDWINENVLAAGARGLGRIFWRVGDEMIVDGALVNGTARSVGWLAAVTRHMQSGYLYHYAFAMIIGLAAMLAWLLTHAA